MSTYSQEQLDAATTQAGQQATNAANAECQKNVSKVMAEVNDRFSKPIVCDGEFCNMKLWVFVVLLVTLFLAGGISAKYVLPRVMDYFDK